MGSGLAKQIPWHAQASNLHFACPCPTQPSCSVCCGSTSLPHGLSPHPMQRFQQGMLRKLPAFPIWLWRDPQSYLPRNKPSFQLHFPGTFLQRFELGIFGMAGKQAVYHQVTALPFPNKLVVHWRISSKMDCVNYETNG